MPNLTDIDFLVCGAHTKRFHTIPTIHNETVGHHTTLVCGLLYLLYPDCRREVLINAIFHDMAECVTGDIPSPSKRAGYVDRAALSKSEDQIIQNHGIFQPEITAEEGHMIKVCDILAGMEACSHEIRMGNKIMTQAFKNFSSYFQELGCKNARAISYYQSLQGCLL
jgi:5'-deoxynucleotidase YfbR-like HD superfamily hydrolase